MLRLGKLILHLVKAKKQPLSSYYNDGLGKAGLDEGRYYAMRVVKIPSKSGYPDQCQVLARLDEIDPAVFDSDELHDKLVKQE